MPIKIHGKTYFTVSERVDAFRKKYGDTGTIHTQVISNTADYVVVKAEVGLCLLPVNATTEDQYKRMVLGEGHAEEKRGSSQINKTSALENCETSAIGRALSAAGFSGGGEYASANEVQQAIHQQNETQNASRLPADQVFQKGTYEHCTIGWVWPRDPGYIDKISKYKQDPMGAACADYIAEHAAEHAEKMLEIKAKKEEKAKEKTA